MWLDFVTYLHHHGHEEKLPWYRGKVIVNLFSQDALIDYGTSKLDVLDNELKT